MQKTKKHKYLLSICIPTANRKDELKNQLENLKTQIKNLNDNNLIQIIIGDNTTDKSQLINLNSFKSLDITYINNKGDIGYAHNVNSVLLNSNGEYVWLLSDDDILYPNALKIILNSLKSKSKINYLTFDCGGSFNGKLFNDQMYFKKINHSFFNDGYDFLKKYWSSILFISINVFNREEVLMHIKKYNLLKEINEVYQNSLIGISFVHKKGKLFVINQPLIIDNYGNKIYSPDNINDVAVDKYYKLIKQLKKFNLDKTIINEMSKVLVRNIYSYGIYSIIYNIEFQNISKFKEIYKKISLDKTNFFYIRTVAFIVFVLLVIHKKIARVILKILLIFKKNSSYLIEKNKVINSTLEKGKSFSVY